MPEVKSLHVDGDETIGEGGFLRLRRLRLRNRYADGTLSAPYLYDYVIRPCGLDAIVVAIYHFDADGGARVLLRDGLRPALVFGRPADAVPVPDERSYLMLTELVAGIVEVDDRGEEGLRRRAADEAAEEAGFDVAPEAVRLLGAAFFPTPGAMAEKFWLAAVEVDPATQREPAGDGSPMEEGATTRWVSLDDAIEACVRGEIEDGKTELGLRRLRDDLARR